jgi:hypothetical protein
MNNSHIEKNIIWTLKLQMRNGDHPKPNSQKFPPQIECQFFLDLCNYFVKKNWVLDFHGPTNGVKIGTTLLYMCVCVCHFLPSRVFDPMFPGAPFLTLDYRTLRILND